VDEFPHGYPLQAAFQSSEPSFSIYRAFGYLHSRVILQLQDELRALEDTLAELDEDDHWSGGQARLTSRDFDMEEARKAFERKAAEKANTQSDGVAATTQEDDEVAVPLSERAALLNKIRLKLLEYDEMLVKGREMAEFQRPSDPDWLTFRIWFWNTKPLSYEREEEFIQRKGDLITLRPRAEWGKFDDWIKARVSRMPKLFESVSLWTSRLDLQ
jgi:PAS domain-containing protein